MPSYLDLGLLAVVLVSALLAMLRGFTREVLAIAAWIAAAATVGAAGAAVAGVAGERMDGKRLTLLSLGSLGVTGLALFMVSGPASLILFALSFGLGLGSNFSPGLGFGLLEPA